MMLEKLYDLSEQQKIDFIHFLILKDVKNKRENLLLTAICVGCVILTILQS